jgi:hypothetical protein
MLLGGGGPSTAGISMLAENGWQFLLVDGSCHAWTLAAHTEPLRQVTLSREREEALSRALRLSEWNTFTGLHQGSCPDAPGVSYRFDQVRLSGGTCGLRAGDPLAEVNAAFFAQLKQLYAEATPSSGNVRYLLIRGEENAPGDNRAPILWPLAVNPELVSITRDEAFQFMPGRSQLATGDDASKLRAIRSTHPSTASSPVPASTPIISADGVRFMLYVRDAVPFEAENGIIPNDVL